VKQQQRVPEPVRAASPKAAAQPEAAKPAPRARLSYKEARELEALPGQIETLEAEQTRIAEQLADPALYQSNPQDAAALRARVETIEAELIDALSRWEDLEAKAAG